MKSSSTLTSYKLFLNLILISLIPKLITSQFTFRHSACGGDTYAPNSTYQSNLRLVLNSLSTNTQITYGFYNFTAGLGPARVNSLAICRGDVPLGTCQVCIRASANLIPQSCPNQKQALGYSQYCTIFISNRAIYGIPQEQPRWYLTTSENVTDSVGFNQTLSSLMNSLQIRAASGNSELKYAAGQANFTGGQMIYGLVQCTPDLSGPKCIECIQGSLSILPDCCVQSDYKASGVTIVEPSCFVRYELFSFFGNVPNLIPRPLPPSPPPPSPPNYDTETPTLVRRSKKSLNPIVIAIPIVVVILLIVAVVLFFCMRRKKQRKYWMLKFNKEEMETLQSLQFSLGTIKHATGDFSEDNKLGEGGFGTVYKGVLPDGQELAVKRLAKNSVQGDLQFKNEILILAKLQHRNLVRLLGFCLQGEEMLLIYEFVANRSLDYFIFDPTQREIMQWKTRYKIIHGIARGLIYLHEESRTRIIHRDLKSGNVLLDAEFDPKIADFGMARLFNIDQTQTFASKIVGTYGYMAPEYVIHGQVSTKSDVFSFGVLVLEIVSGQRISSFSNEDNPQNLLSFAWKNWIDGTPWNVVDRTLSACFSTDILRCIHIGLLCVQENAADRPTMSSVDLMLSNHSLSLQVPLEPAFFIESNPHFGESSQGNTTSQSNNGSTRFSINGVTVTEPYPR